MRAHWSYLKYLLRHKWYVLREGVRLGVPLYLLIIHDWSKFLPAEWSGYVHAFYDAGGGYRYHPSDQFDAAWNHHQKHNKHHWQYWVLVMDDNVENVCLKLPEKYAREMLADWLGAGLANRNPDTLDWYLKHRDRIQLHAETQKWIEDKLFLLFLKG